MSAIGAEVMKSLTPAQMVVKIVHEELLATLGEPAKLDLSGPAPHVVMLVGLQGSGKTTTAAKLALTLRKSGKRSLLVAADTYRPAAVTQLEVLGKQLDIPVHSEGTKVSPPEIVRHALQRAREGAYDVVILDTAGRLQISEEMMAELEQIKAIVKPGEILLVADAMTGQEAVNVAKGFHERVAITGLILTKVDGDARWRRGDLDARGHRGADQVPRRGREGGCPRDVPPGSAGLPDPRHGRHAQPDREGRREHVLVPMLRR